MVFNHLYLLGRIALKKSFSKKGEKISGKILATSVLKRFSVRAAPAAINPWNTCACAESSLTLENLRMPKKLMNTEKPAHAQKAHEH